MKALSAAVLSVVIAAPGVASHAQDAASQHAAEGMHHSNTARVAMPGAMGGFHTAMETMMDNMPMESSGMVDADFLLMMIPHHQSAIDMAKVELEHGTDDETRAMAEAIIAIQEAEIAAMVAMLERMGVTP